MWSSPSILSPGFMVVKVMEAMDNLGANTYVQSLVRRVALGETGEADDRVARRPRKPGVC